MNGNTVAIIQARMGSSRLPGKVLLPLDGEHVLAHDIERVRAADAVDTVVVATSFHPPDDIVANVARQAGAEIYRGSEDDVLARMRDAAAEHHADVVVRLTGDNPFVEPKLISAAAREVATGSADYASNKVERTWPLGVDAEAFTFESFDAVEQQAREPHHREHVTPYYHEHPDRFDLRNISVEDVYGDRPFEAGPELRLTLDEPSDYDLFRRVYREVSYDDIIDVPRVVDYIVSRDLSEANSEVEQRTGW